MTTTGVEGARFRPVYSPRRRTALVLTGTGADGAYHAGVLKALTEAGVRVDVVAGHGIGAVVAFFAAVDGGARLWGDDGAWKQPALTAGLVPFRPALRALAWVAAAALATVVAPLLVLATGALVYLGAFLLGLAGLDAATGVADRYTALVHEAFLPGRLPTWISQSALLLLAAVFFLLLVAAARGRVRGRFRERGAFWWRVFGAPLSAKRAVQFWRTQLWRLLTGGTKAAEPDPVDLARRYSDLLVENLGQPGFRELLVVVHDLDSRQDLTLAGLLEPYRQSFFGRAPARGAASHRAGEVLDLAGMGRDYALDVFAASQCLPVAMPPWPVTFSADSYWRGETHRLCDRPGAVARVVADVVAAGAEQVILVSAAPVAPQPHALAAPRIDGFGKLAEWLSSQEAAAVRDVLRTRTGGDISLHRIGPAHNPVGPFDFGGAYDERSDRVQELGELLARGYEDAYQQFVEPVVGAADDPQPGEPIIR